MTDFSDPSGLAGAYNRALHKPSWQGVVAREDQFAQATDLNDMQTIVERRNRRVGDLVASDGDRIAAGDILVDVASGVVTLSAHSATTTRELAELIRERLGALSRAHALTLPEITGTGKIHHSFRPSPHGPLALCLGDIGQQGRYGHLRAGSPCWSAGRKQFRPTFVRVRYQCCKVWRAELRSGAGRGALGS